MRRDAYSDLLEWKYSKNRKPLLVQGARQVGKTFLIREFGNQEYENLVYLNFEQSMALRSLFYDNLKPEIIIDDIGMFVGKKIEASNTLIFFDEIQASEEALTSLKYFYEEAPEYHIIAAGSLLGVSIARERSFPVGKVNFLEIHPLSFSEYIAEFESELLNEKLNDLNEIKPFSEIIHGKLYKALKQYLFLGGMPEVLSQFKKNKDIAEVRKIQKDLLKSYEHDFAKYTTKSQAIKTSELWNSIPFQLAKENKKFKYGDVKHKARASHYEQTIDWLRNAGLINIVTQISTPKIPLSAYSDNTKFKIYLFDVGILGAMLNISSDIILKPTALFEDFNGAFIENFVASELRSSDFKNLNYWTSRGEAEVDFIISHNDVVFPLEVKSGTSRNLKSLRSYEAKYKPKYILRTSPRNMLLDNEFFNIPLYIICKITQVLNLLK
jgi:predicted AAA+ superfamily ATPase